MNNKENINKTIAQNITFFLDRRGKTQQELADFVGVSQAAISNWSQGIKLPRMDKIDKICEFFKIKRSDLLHPQDSVLGISEYKPTKKMPVLGRIPAGLPLYAEENIEGYVANDFEDGHEYYALRVFGDSMTAAGIDDGDLVIVRRQDTVEDGQIAVVIINGYDATVKFFKQDGRLVILSPKSYNPEHNPQVYDIEKDAVRVLGRVVQIRKDR
jgi:repressor LexA